MKIFYQLLFFTAIVSLTIACTDPKPTEKVPPNQEVEKVKRPHIVFVTGDEEYRSEESMPMLGRIAQSVLNAKVTVCYALDSEGFIDPNNAENIEGLEALASADLMVLFTRFRALPDDQLQYILDYAESGKPMVGFRTATHAFKYENDLEKGFLNEEWPKKVFGQKWITHHGHFEDGNLPLTEVNIYADQKTHPILNGFEPFKAYSWLYHVEGNGDQLSGGCRPLVSGRSLRSKYAESQEYPFNNPVAWHKTYTGTSGVAARVFFTTLGHPYDFKEVAMRKLAINGMAWALGMEGQIPAAGFDVDITDYNPNNSGFGEKFKKELKPVSFN